MGVLDGLRVIDLSWGTAGPRATGLLADYGADVVWVEPPGGDPWRRLEPAAASVFNRGKRSVVFDLHDPPQRDRLLELVVGADVVVESWQPGVADRLGVGYEAVHRRSPGTVYTSISGFGAEGARAGIKGHEGIVHAVIGTMEEQPVLRDGPVYQGLPFASIGAGYLAVIGTLAALLRRNEDGVGRHVETSLLDGALAYHSMMWGETDQSEAAYAAAVAAGNPPVPMRVSTSTMRMVTRSFECADGEYLGVHTGAVGAFGRYMEVLGLDDRIRPSQSGLDLGVPLEPEQVPIVADEIPKIMATRPRVYWVRRLLEADVCAVEHLKPGQVFDEPQARHNDMVVRLVDPVLGPVDQVAPGARLSVSSSVKLRPAPTVGHHTEEVLAEPARPAAPAGMPDERPLLDGVRILDLGAYYAGPYSSRLLADLGADVVKLETIAGDPIRGMERPFYSAQAGKRGLSANLKDEALRPAIEGLVRWADVVHHNLRPGAAERLGLGVDDVRALNPRAVYLYAPGWGSSGPHRLRQSFAPMLSGYVGVTYEVAGELNPPMPPVGNEDPGNGLLGAVGVLMALLHRQRTGEGAYVENPQLNATMGHMAHVVRTADGSVVGAGRLDPLQFGVGPFSRLYETADGWVCAVAELDHERAALGAALGVELHGQDDAAAAGILADAFGARTTADAVALGVDADVAVVAPTLGRPNHDFMNDPENRRTRRVAETPHPAKGNVREVDQLVRISATVAPPHSLAPELGENTDEILTSLGYEKDAIAQLRARGVIR